MKKIILLVVAIAFGSLTFAKPVTVSNAQTFAANFLTKQFAQQKMNTNFELEWANRSTDLNAKKPQALYIFNVKGAKGFVIIAADDNVQPVLAYSTESNFDVTDSKNPAFYYINKYTRQINYVIENNVPATAEVVGLWNNGGFKSNAKAGHSVSPLLTTTWDQGNHYNNLCPVDNNSIIGNKRCPTGCVATAVAQILRYWKYPSSGYGKHTYSAWTYGPQTFDFGNFTFLWGNSHMPNNVTNNNTSVDTLMYACGVALNMGYGPAGSGACVNSSDCGGYGAEYALRQYFLYDGNLKGYKEASNDSLWISMLENELNNHRPIIYAGADTASQEGHCFDFDGYDVNDLFHINWGWSGLGNGYYGIHNLVPSGVGIGGGAGNYGADEEALLGVAPPPTLQMASAISPATQTVNNGQAFSFAANFKNLGHYDFSGNLAAIITDNSGNFVGMVKINQNKTFLDTVRIANLATLNQDTTFGTQGLYGIAAGTYNVAIYSMTGLAPTWTLVSNNGTLTNQAQITFTGITGINNVIKDGDVNMWPNPANNVLKVENKSNFIVEKVMVLNMQGQVITESAPQNNRSFSVDLNNINDGMYLVKIITKQGGELNKKLVIQK